MLILYKKIFSKAGMIILGVLAIIGVLFAVYIQGANSAEDKIERDALEGAYNAERNRADQDARLRRITDDDIDRMLGDWYRD